MKACSHAIAVLLVSSVTAYAQDYAPRHHFPGGGSEVLLIFISTSTCTGNSEDRLDEVVRGMKVHLRDRVEPTNRAFFAVGAAAEWSIAQGVDYLLRGVSPGYSTKAFGAWDEIWVGRDWLNNAAVEHMWRGDGRSTVPQLIVLERQVVLGERGIEVGANTVLARVVGSKAIVEWFDRGLPFRDADQEH